MSPIEFGEQIRVRRLEQHLELEEFAKMLGTTRRHLAEMERGRFVSTDVVWI